MIYSVALRRAQYGKSKKSFKTTANVFKLSFWKPFEGLVKECQDQGECPFDGALTLDWGKVPAEEVQLMSGVKDPVAALQRQIDILLVSSNVDDKIDTRRKGNKLYIRNSAA